MSIWLAIVAALRERDWKRVVDRGAAKREQFDRPADPLDR